MGLSKRIVLAGFAVVTVVLVAACSDPVKPADQGAALPNAQPTQDPNVQVIELPAPKGAKPGQRIRATVSPYPPGSQAAKDAALNNPAPPKQP